MSLKKLQILKKFPKENWEKLQFLDAPRKETREKEYKKHFLNEKLMRVVFFR